MDRKVSHGNPSFKRQGLDLALLARMPFLAIVQYPVTLGPLTQEDHGILCHVSSLEVPNSVM